MRTCPQCSQPIDADAHKDRVYCCLTCRNVAANRRNRPRYVPTPPVATAVPDRPARRVLRATTLAATPETPAQQADRDDQLTGGAPAAGYAQAVRMVGVGI